MANNNITVNVTHSLTGGGSSSTAGENINKEYQAHLQDLTRAISDLNNNFKGATTSSGGSGFYNLATGASKEADVKRNDFKDAFDPVIENFGNAVDEFNQSQKDHGDRLQKIFGGIAAGIPVGAAVGSYINAYAGSQYLAARNDLTNPVGYGQSQAQADYDKKGAIYKGVGAAIGSLLGGGVSFGFGTVIGGGIGYKAGNYLNTLMNQKDLGTEQLSYQQSQIETQLSRSNPTGNVLAGLYHKAFSNDNGILAQQLPYMAGANAYRGNMSSGDLTNVAKFSKRYGLEGEQAGQAATLLAQIAGYMGEINGTLHQIDAYQSQFGGDPLQQLSSLNNYLQTGSSPGEALNAAYKSGYQGQAFQNAQAAYKTSDIVTRIQQEAIGNTIGFSASRLYNGKATAQDLKAVHNAQAKYALGRTAEGDDLFNYGVSGVLTERAGIAYMMEHNALPTTKAAGSFESFGLSKGESKSVNDSIALNQHHIEAAESRVGSSLGATIHHHAESAPAGTITSSGNSAESVKAMANLTKAINNNTSAISKATRQ